MICRLRTAGGGMRRHSGVSHRHLHLQIALIDQFDVEDQIGFGRDSVWPSTRTIGKLPRNEQPTLASDLHAGEALVESGDEASKALGKSQRLRIAHFRLAVCIELRLSVGAHDRPLVVKR